MSLSVLVVDDEQPAREALAHELSLLPDVDVLATASHGEQALTLILKHQPAAVFLDIHMPGMSGLMVAERLLNLDPVPSVVFVTAYDQYALQAFDLHAMDYLLKPVEPERLQICVRKLHQRLNAGREPMESHMKQVLTKVLASLQTPQNPSTLVLKKGRRFYPVAVEHIVCFHADAGIIHALTDRERYTLDVPSLDVLMQQLDDRVFFRSHRAYIVNLQAIHEIIPLSNHTFQLRLQAPNHYTLPLSRSRARLLRERLSF